MPILENTLEEEYARSLRVTAALEREIAGLPKGSIRKREIGGHEYYYLQWREGKKVRSLFVKREDLAELRRQLELRKSHEEALKEQEEARKLIERALGRKPV